MAIKLSDKPNVIAPGGDYSYGDIRNRDGSTPGTPGSREVYADFHQFFERMVGENDDVNFNGKPDNDANGYQLFQALIYSMPRKIILEYTSVFGGDTIIITGSIMNSGSTENIVNKPFYKGQLPISTPRIPYADYHIQVIYESAPTQWKNIPSSELDIKRNGVSGQLNITINSVPVSPAARVRVILIG